MNFIQNLNWTIHRWPVQQNLRRHGVVWSRTEVRRWTTRRCQGRCATIMAVNAREGKDTWQWWKRNDFITSGWFFSSISFSNLMFVWIFCLFNCNIWLIIKFDRLISFFNGFTLIAQVWGARSKLERGGGGPNEAAVQPASALQVHILYWFIPFFTGRYLFYWLISFLLPVSSLQEPDLSLDKRIVEGGLSPELTVKNHISRSHIRRLTSNLVTKTN